MYGIILCVYDAFDVPSIYLYNIVKAECVEPATAFYLRLMRTIMNNSMVILLNMLRNVCDCFSISIRPAVVEVILIF